MSCRDMSGSGLLGQEVKLDRRSRGSSPNNSIMPNTKSLSPSDADETETEAGNQGWLFFLNLNMV